MRKFSIVYIDQQWEILRKPPDNYCSAMNIDLMLKRSCKVIAVMSNPSPRLIYSCRHRKNLL